MSEDYYSKREKLIVILGATAVGKSAFALELAKKLKTEIISGDSMLVYRGFDIGTAKPSLKDRQAVKHYLIDILPPTADFNVATFNTLAKSIITKCNERGLVPILAGGTGLYIQSLLEGYVFNKVEENSSYRQYLEALAREKGKEYLYNLLQKVDPITADRLHVNDLRRVVRALEVFHLGNERISRYKSYLDGKNIYDVFVIGLARARQEIYKRIDLRVDAMLRDGFEKEVKILLKKGLSPHAQSMKAIGYQQMAEYLQGKNSFDATVAEIKKKTRNFAKRQLTWYRRLSYIHWYNLDDIDSSELLPLVVGDLKKVFVKI